jgi:hypothetical protein
VWIEVMAGKPPLKPHRPTDNIILSLRLFLTIRNWNCAMDALAPIALTDIRMSYSAHRANQKRCDYDCFHLATSSPPCF